MPRFLDRPADAPSPKTTLGSELARGGINDLSANISSGVLRRARLSGSGAFLGMPSRASPCRLVSWNFRAEERIALGQPFQ